VKVLRSFVSQEKRFHAINNGTSESFIWRIVLDASLEAFTESVIALLKFTPRRFLGTRRNDGANHAVGPSGRHWNCILFWFFRVSCEEIFTTEAQCRVRSDVYQKLFPPRPQRLL
jgi:hypothetical protein